MHFSLISRSLSPLSAAISFFRCGGIDLLDLDGLVVRDLGRRGAIDVSFRFEVLQALVQKGIPVINPPEAIARAANKFATSRALHDWGVPTPKTVVTTSPEEAEEALQDFGKAVSKPLFGYKGRDIVLLKSGDQSDLARLRSIVETQGTGLSAGVYCNRSDPPRYPGLCCGWQDSGRHISRGSARGVDQQPGPRRPGSALPAHCRAGRPGGKSCPGCGRRPTAVWISWRPVMVYRSLR